MTTKEKPQIRPLDEKSDYALWRIRVLAAISAKGLQNALHNRSAEGDEVNCLNHQQQASNIVVAALSDQALRVVRTVIGNPSEMITKLDQRYDSKSTASKIAKMSELVSMRYKSLKDDLSGHIDRMAGLLEQLSSMGTGVADSLAIGILVASIEVPQLQPVTAAIKTFAESNINWEDVTNRLFEEQKLLSSDEVIRSRANVANTACHICEKINHRTEQCFLNPLNPRNKLNLPTELATEILERGKGPVGTQKNKKRDTKTKGGRSAIARAAQATHFKPLDHMMLDSGCTSHMTPHEDRVHSKEACDVSIKLADDSTVEAHFKGVRTVKWHCQDGRKSVHLSETLVAPKLSMSLLSIPALVRKNIGVLFIPGKAVLIDLEDNFSVLGYGRQDKDGLFYIPDQQPRGDACMSSRDSIRVSAMVSIARKHHNAEATRLLGEQQNGSMGKTSSEKGSDAESTSVSNVENEEKKGDSKKTRDSTKLWHLRLGHALPRRAVSTYVRTGLLPHASCTSINCQSCAKGKFKRRFDGSLTQEDRIGVLHVDTKGKLETESVHGHNYFLTIVEEYSRFTAVRPIGNKGEAARELLQFVRFFERQTGQLVRTVHTDGGKEFSRAVEYLRDQGALIHITTPYTPQSNGLAERSHSSILSLARTCLVDAKIPLKYWNYAVRHVTDCKNFVPHSVTKKVPYEVLFGHRTPDLVHIKPFGCRLYYRPNMAKIPTFQERVGDGLCLRHEGGGIYHVLTSTGILRTKHVRADEFKFPGMRTLGKRYESEDEDEEDSTAGHQALKSEKSDDDEDKPSHETSLVDKVTYVPAQPSVFGEMMTEGTENDNELPVETGNTDEEQPENSHDLSRPCVQYNLRERSRVDYTCVAQTDMMNSSDEPKISTALNSLDKQKWITAIHEEFDTLQKNKTWTVEGIPPQGARILPSGVILKIKRDSMGRPARFKARLVARGKFQSDPIDYTELYAPVACIEMVRILLSVAVAKNWCIDQLDVKDAFLHAALPNSDDIWVRLPKIEGVTPASGKTVNLKKSLYGLRQAPKLWYQHFSKELSKLGYSRSKSSDCLFITHSKDGPGYIVMYVDDLLVIGNSQTVKDVKRSLGKLCTVTDLGHCKFFLGIKLDRGPKGLHLSQRAYIERLIKAANMDKAKPCLTPLPLAHCLYQERKPTTAEDKLSMRDKPYRELLGALLYLATRTRPDIATAVSMLGKFQSDPGPSQWRCLQHLVRYLIHTTDHGLFYPASSGNVSLQAYSDADWARDETKRRSRSGFLLILDSSPVIWSSRLQSTTAQSTAEAEFVALQGCVREVSWVRAILEEVGACQGSPTMVFQDNLGCISWTEEVQGLRKVKHVGIKYHYVRSMVEDGKLQVLYVSSVQNRADSLTKVLGREVFDVHRRYLGVQSVDRSGK